MSFKGAQANKVTPRPPSFLQAGNPLGELTTDASTLSLCAHPMRSQPLAMPIKCERAGPAESHRLKVQETSNDVQKKLSRVRGFFFHLFIS